MESGGAGRVGGVPRPRRVPSAHLLSISEAFIRKSHCSCAGASCAARLSRAAPEVYPSSVASISFPFTIAAPSSGVIWIAGASASMLPFSSLQKATTTSAAAANERLASSIFCWSAKAPLSCSSRPSYASWHRSIASRRDDISKREYLG